MRCASTSFFELISVVRTVAVIRSEAETCVERGPARRRPAELWVGRTHGALECGDSFVW